MEDGYRRCCGIDVHKKSITVCVLPAVGGKGELRQERFRTFTRDLKRLRVWLMRCRVTDVAMESTGQYWRPVWNILEGAVARLLLLNPAHVKGLAGHKTDRLDARWLATRLEREDLRGSFIPPPEVRELRELTRLRVHWLEDLNRVKNRIGQVCEAGNIKISSVASDLFGKSGRRMLAALVEGRRDAGWMADYACGTLRGKKQHLEMALQGTFSDHRRDLLRRELEQMRYLEEGVTDLTGEIERRMAAHGEEVRLLCTIPGIDRLSAWTILAETGFDMGVFEDHRHLASWAALCPGNRESGGKRLSGRTRKGNLYLRRILCQCALAAMRKKGTQLGAMYYRLRSRRGHAKALMAVAHQLLIVIYHVLREHREYKDPGEPVLTEAARGRRVEGLIRALHGLGYQVDVRAVEEAVASQVEEGAPEATLKSDQEAPSPAESALGGSVAPQRRGRGRPCKCAERGIVCRHAHSTKREIAPNKSEVTWDGSS